MALHSQPIPNLIQGVSQQAAELRRDSQCEEQYDCVNSPKDGAWARHGAEFLSLDAGGNLSDGFFWDILRGDAEHYLVGIHGGALFLYNLVSGSKLNVTVDGSYFGAYLGADGGLPKANFAIQTVDDYTFIASKQVKPQLDELLHSPDRPHEGVLWFKAGAYSTWYSAAIGFGGNLYRFRYLTPDNSVPGNANYIATTQLAATFYRALTNVAANSSGAANSYGTGSPSEGDVGGSGGGQPSAVNADALPAGFGVEINGSLIRVWRDDGQDFTLDVSDGAGDTLLIAIKDSIRAFTDLPKNGFEGFRVAIKGVSDDKALSYFVQYVGKTSGSGVYQECPAADTKTTLNPNTMPHVLINTGVGAFTFKPMPWSKRIAGDGVDSAKDPGFVGKYLQDIFYHQSRLALLTEGTCDWSKARNPYTHFPDTVQTNLADAPIGITLSASKKVSLLRRAVGVDEGEYLWSSGAQFRVNSGTDPFRQDTIQAPEASYYEFAPMAGFGLIGTSLYFATEPDAYMAIRNIAFTSGRVSGDTDVTAHISNYIPAGGNRISVSDTGQMLAVTTAGDPGSLFLYNFLSQDRQVVQSAWNKWRLPGVVLWHGFKGNQLKVALQRPEGLVLVSFPLSFSASDPDGEYRTRLDLLTSEAQVSGRTYHAGTDSTSFTLPWSLGAGEVGKLRVAIRTTDASFPRGEGIRVISASGNAVEVAGNLTSAQFYCGLAIRSERLESTFFLRSQEGVKPVDRLLVKNYRVSFERTGYTRIELQQGSGQSKMQELYPTITGRSVPAIGLPPVLVRDNLKIGVDALNTDAKIRLVNDSFLPSAWLSAEYTYEATIRTKPTGGA